MDPNHGVKPWNQAMESSRGTKPWSQATDASHGGKPQLVWRRTITPTQFRVETVLAFVLFERGKHTSKYTCFRRIAISKWLCAPARIN